MYVRSIKVPMRKTFLNLLNAPRILIYTYVFLNVRVMKIFFMGKVTHYVIHLCYFQLHTNCMINIMVFGFNLQI